MNTAYKIKLMTKDWASAQKVSCQAKTVVDITFS